MIASGGQRASVPVDWAASLSWRHFWADAAGWLLAGVLVLSVVVAGIATSVWIDRRVGVKDAVEDAMLIDLVPLPPAPAVSAVAESAPDAPMIDAPDSPEPVTEPVEDTVLPKVEPVAPPPAEQLLAPVMDLPPDSLAPPPPLPEPVVEPAPEPLPEPKPQTKVEPKPVKKAARVVPSTKAQAKSDVQGQATVAVNAGRVTDLKANWGASIRKRVERHKAYPNAAGNASGTATVRLKVTRGGGLAGISIAKSSGNPMLDGAALSAVQATGAFPAAPAGLTDASYDFTLPISFSR